MLARFLRGVSRAWKVGLTAVLVAGCLPAQPSADPNDQTAAELRVAADDHVLGSAEAPVTVIEYGDFQCPVCGEFDAETFPAIRAAYIDTGKVRWVFRHFPLRAIHPQAENAARAAECAGAQGVFWEYGELLFSNQSALGTDDLVAYANQLGLDASGLWQCVETDVTAERVQRDVSSGQALGVTGTPTFFIDGQRVAGFRSVAQFRELLDAALAD